MPKELHQLTPDRCHAFGQHAIPCKKANRTVMLTFRNHSSNRQLDVFIDTYQAEDLLDQLAYVLRTNKDKRPAGH